MNKTFLGLALTLLAAGSAWAGEPQISSRLPQAKSQGLTLNHGWEDMLRESGKMSGKRDVVSPSAVTEATAFNFLDAPDGTSWCYTEDISWRADENDFGGYNYYMSSAFIQIYDSQNQKVGDFTVEIPDGMTVNNIEPYGRITKKLFDLNANTFEVMVSLHEVTPDYTGREYVWIYQINGGKTVEFEGNGIIVDASTNDWTLYQRLVLVHGNDSLVNHSDVDIYRPATWGEDAPQIEHTFTLDDNLINYMDAPFLNFFNDGGKPYYVLSYYEKSFDVRDEEGNMVVDSLTWMPEFTENNTFIIDTYDRYYNKVSSIQIPTTAPEWAAVRMMGLGAMSDFDISRGKFTGDDQLNYVVMFEDATLQFETVCSFVVYNQQGDSIGVLADNVGAYWNTLSSIDGVEDQMLFMTVEGEAYLVDLPSLQRTEMPTVIEELNGSVNIDRYACMADPKGYRYVMGINEGLTDETYTNVICRYAHLNSDFSVHRYVDVNMGPKAMTFVPLINEQTLNPYLFNTDDLREYIFLSKLQKGEEFGGTYNVLFIANDKGEIVETFNLEGDDLAGDIYSVTLLNYGTPQQSLFVCFYNWDEDVCSLRYYSLPFTSFPAGGTGTAADPYLISSVGDLQQMVQHPSAHYRVACDFDADYHKASIPEFSGTLDGDGHTIQHLDVTSTHYYGGLLGAMSDGSVSNLKFLAPRARVTSSNENFGLLSGYATTSRFEDIVVSGMEIISEGGASPVGGLVGSAMAETNVKGVLVHDSYIQGNNVVGGIVGEMRTSSVVSASALTESAVEGNREVGGIIGVIGTGSGVRDCFVSGSEVAGNSSLGLIAGYSNGTTIDEAGGHGCLSHCIVSQSSVVDLGNLHKGLAAIVGYVEPQWGSSIKTVVNSNVSIDSYVALPVEGVSDEQMATIHAIAGYTKDNEVSDKPGQVLKEEGLKDNFVYLSPAAEPSSTVYYGGGDDATTPEGKLVAGEEIAPQSFWTNLGFGFGSTNETPWVYTEGQAPVLYLLNPENMPNSLPVIEHRGAASAGGARCFNLYGQPVGAGHKGLTISQGRKVLL